jgi:hypothetical protein
VHVYLDVYIHVQDPKVKKKTPNTSKIKIITRTSSLSGYVGSSERDGLKNDLSDHSSVAGSFPPRSRNAMSNGLLARIVGIVDASRRIDSPNRGFILLNCGLKREQVAVVVMSFDIFPACFFFVLLSGYFGGVHRAVDVKSLCFPGVFTS